MIRRYFYIFSATLFILFTSTTGVKANFEDDKLEALARQTNSPPDGFNYQAVLRNNSGMVLANANVTIRFTLTNTEDVWVETHAATTNDHGMINLVIGSGTKTAGTAATFDAIDWSTNISVKVEADSGNGFVDLGTNELQSVPYANYAANGLSTAQANEIAANTAKVGISQAQADAIEANTLKGGITPAQATVLANTSGTNTGDQDISGIATNATAIALNTAKTGITAGQAAEITANTAKVGITPAQAAEITANTAKVGVTPAQATVLANTSGTNTGDQDISGIATNATAIALNTAKTGITAGQAAEITANTAKVGITPAQAAEITANTAKVGVTPAQATVLANTSGTNTGNQDISGIATNATAIALNTAKTGITPAQTAEITANTAKVSSVFLNTANVIFAGDADDDFVFGSSQLADIVGTDDDNRMFFDKSSGAFRAGRAIGTEWDVPGSGSFAAGANNTASGSASTVSGGVTNAAFEHFSTVSGGRDNTASGYSSTVSGGLYNTASGLGSTVGGGFRVNAQAYGEFAVGMFSANATTPSATTFVATDRVFTVGNGTGPGTESNAMTILKNGNTDINGNLVANSLGVDGVFTLPNTDGTAGQVLQTDGAGVVSWQDVSGGGSYAGSGTDSFVAGAANNIASANYSTVSGGYSNTANAYNSTIGGGLKNRAYSTYSSVGGGYANISNGMFAVVAGGNWNIATGLKSTISGGDNNTASGYGSSVGGGRFVKAQAQSEFVVGQFSKDAVSPNPTAFVPTDRLFTIGNGTTDLAPSNALVILKNGNTDINGDLVANSLGVDGVFTLPNTDGTAGQVLQTDGAGAVTWQTASGGGAFTNSANVIFAGDADDDFVFGSSQLTDIVGTDDDNRMFFDKSSGAFRAGRATGTQWDVPGLYSFAAGRNNTASAYHTTVSGGYLNTASERYSTVSGGRSNTASGKISTITGGYANTASGFGSTVGGGFWVNAQAYGEFAVGMFSANATTPSATTFVATDRVFTVGNGTGPGTESNAMTILKNGNTDINGNLVANSLGVDGQFTLPTADGTAGQVLQTDGAGAVSWQTTSGGSGSYAGTGPGSFVAGAANNIASTNYTTVSGGQGNQAYGGYGFSSVGGGRYNKAANYSVVAGGKNNEALGYANFIGSGRSNSSNGNFSTVGGGYSNSASTDRSTVAGGETNWATAFASTVGGGSSNGATGKYSSVAGGRRILAQSFGEFAVGVYSANATTPDANSFVSTDRIFTVGNGTANAARSNAFVILKNGNATLAGALTQNSDERLKREITGLGGTLEKVNQMEGVTYKWNDITPRDTTEVNIGLIAQEVEALFPELVKTGDNGYKSVNYIQLVPVLIEAIKELSEENQALELANANMELKQQQDDKKFADLDAKLNKLMSLIAPELTVNK